MSRFTFAADKEGFDEHIRFSIRGYSDLWRDVLKFSRYFVEDDTSVVDIGCSSGKLIKEIKKHNDDHAPKCSYKGIEVEEEFFPTLEDEDRLQFYKLDIRDFDWNVAAIQCSLITSIFTLQFIPRKVRADIVKRIFESLNVGGAFIFSEKILSCDSQIEEIMTFCYYDWKREHFTEREILEKEVQLRHMIKLMTHDQLMTLMLEAGFSRIQQFWQNYNFVAFIAIKGDI